MYGLFAGFSASLMLVVAPQPAGSILWWGFLAGQLTWGAALCWRKMRLPYATAGLAIGAAASATLAGLAAAGHVFPRLPGPWWVFIGACMALVPVLLLIESRVHRFEWRKWREHMESKNAWDIFMGRHIPDLRRKTA
jgi:hypothetical protein